MEPVKIGLLGLGTVGGGTVSVLSRNAEEITRRAGRDIVISHAAAKEYNSEIPGLNNIGNISDDAFAVVDDPDVDIIVELIGGYSPALELVMRAIENGKHVVTANKALIAVNGNEIFAAAQKKGVTVAFEAAVAGGIPIIKSIREGLAANQIEWIAGIINGTSNFILTEMLLKNRDFNDVLVEAQSLGYAEANPAFDIEGIDAAHKLTIMASIAFGIPLQFDKVFKEGITDIEKQDVTYAAELGYKIKHLGITRKTEEGIELRVHPTLIPNRRLIANVDGVMNAVLVKGDAVGPTLFYGAGAGSEPTASAIIADIVDVVRALTTDSENRVPHLAFQPSAMSDIAIKPMEEVETGYYLRINAADQPGVLSDVATILGDLSISIEAIIQKEPDEDATLVPVIFLTQKIVEKNMNEAIAKIEALETVDGKVRRIRVESLA
ncbi:MAG: homoserine dehydrogenase [Gammaproteobacteria bacterium]|jgi:homoserine dehydrogenase